MDALVTSIAKKFLADWIYFPGKAKMSSGWSTQMTLRNVQVKPSAIDGLGLPLELEIGYVRHIHVNAPWASLLSKPTEVELEGIYIVARFRDKPVVPKEGKSKESEEFLSEEEAFELKKKHLDAWEEFNLVSSVQKSGLILKIVNNIRIRIRDFHFRIEFPEGPSGERISSIGVVFDEFHISPSDASFNILDKIPKELSSTGFFKVLLLKGFGIYAHMGAEKASLEPRNLFDVNAHEDDMFLDCEAPNGIDPDDQDRARFDAILSPFDMQARLVLRSDDSMTRAHSFVFGSAQASLDVSIPMLHFSIGSYHHPLIVNLAACISHAIKLAPNVQKKAMDKSQVSFTDKIEYAVLYQSRLLVDKVGFRSLGRKEQKRLAMMERDWGLDCIREGRKIALACIKYKYGPNVLLEKNHDYDHPFANFKKHNNLITLTEQEILQALELASAFFAERDELERNVALARIFIDWEGLELHVKGKEEDLITFNLLKAALTVSLKKTGFEIECSLDDIVCTDLKAVHPELRHVISGQYQHFSGPYIYADIVFEKNDKDDVNVCLQVRPLVITISRSFIASLSHVLQEPDLHLLLGTDYLSDFPSLSEVSDTLSTFELPLDLARKRINIDLMINSPVIRLAHGTCDEITSMVSLAPGILQFESIPDHSSLTGFTYVARLALAEFYVESSAKRFDFFPQAKSVSFLISGRVTREGVLTFDGSCDKVLVAISPFCVSVLSNIIGELYSSFLSHTSHLTIPSDAVCISWGRQQFSVTKKVVISGQVELKGISIQVELDSQADLISSLDLSGLFVKWELLHDLRSSAVLSLQSISSKMNDFLLVNSHENEKFLQMDTSLNELGIVSRICISNVFLNVLPLPVYNLTKLISTFLLETCIHPVLNAPVANNDSYTVPPIVSLALSVPIHASLSFQGFVLGVFSDQKDTSHLLRFDVSGLHMNFFSNRHCFSVLFALESLCLQDKTPGGLCFPVLLCGIDPTNTDLVWNEELRHFDWEYLDVSDLDRDFRSPHAVAIALHSYQFPNVGQKGFLGARINQINATVLYEFVDEVIQYYLNSQLSEIKFLVNVFSSVQKSSQSMSNLNVSAPRVSEVCFPANIQSCFLNVMIKGVSVVFPFHSRSDNHVKILLGGFYMKTCPDARDYGSFQFDSASLENDLMIRAVLNKIEAVAICDSVSSSIICLQVVSAEFREPSSVCSESSFRLCLSSILVTARYLEWKSVLDVISDNLCQKPLHRRLSQPGDSNSSLLPESIKTRLASSAPEVYLSITSISFKASKPWDQGGASLLSLLDLTLLELEGDMTAVLELTMRPISKHFNRDLVFSKKLDAGVLMKNGELVVRSEISNISIFRCQELERKRVIDPNYVLKPFQIRLSYHSNLLRDSETINSLLKAEISKIEFSIGYLIYNRILSTTLLFLELQRSLSSIRFLEARSNVSRDLGLEDYKLEINRVLQQNVQKTSPVSFGMDHNPSRSRVELISRVVFEGLSIELINDSGKSQWPFLDIALSNVIFGFAVSDIFAVISLRLNLDVRTWNHSCFGLEPLIEPTALTFSFEKAPGTIDMRLSSSNDIVVNVTSQFLLILSEVLHLLTNDLTELDVSSGFHCIGLVNECRIFNGTPYDIEIYPICDVEAMSKTISSFKSDKWITMSDSTSSIGLKFRGSVSEIDPIELDYSFSRMEWILAPSSLDDSFAGVPVFIDLQSTGLIRVLKITSTSMLLNCSTIPLVLSDEESVIEIQPGQREFISQGLGNRLCLKIPDLNCGSVHLDFKKLSQDQELQFTGADSCFLVASIRTLGELDAYELSISHSVVLQNFLPFDTLFSVHGKANQVLLTSGTTVPICNLSAKEDQLQVSLLMGDYTSDPFSISLSESSSKCIALKSDAGSLIIDVSLSFKGSQVCIALSTKFSFYNLVYDFQYIEVRSKCSKFSNRLFSVEHDPESNASGIFGAMDPRKPTQLSFRVPGFKWSNWISIHNVSCSGSIICVSEDERQVCELAYSAHPLDILQFSAAVTISPRFQLVNECPYRLRIQQEQDHSNEMVIEPNQSLSLTCWNIPNSKVSEEESKEYLWKDYVQSLERKIRFRCEGPQTFWSHPLEIDTPCYLRTKVSEEFLSEPILLTVEVCSTSQSMQTIFKPSEFPEFILENQLLHLPLFVRQESCCDWMIVRPSGVAKYCWDSPFGSRKLAVRIGSIQNHELEYIIDSSQVGDKFALIEEMKSHDENVFVFGHDVGSYMRLVFNYSNSLMQSLPIVSKAQLEALRVQAVSDHEKFGNEQIELHQELLSFLHENQSMFSDGKIVLVGRVVSAEGVSVGNRVSISFSGQNFRTTPAPASHFNWNELFAFQASEQILGCSNFAEVSLLSRRGFVKAKSTISLQPPSSNIAFSGSRCSWTSLDSKDSSHHSTLVAVEYFWILGTTVEKIRFSFTQSVESECFHLALKKIDERLAVLNNFPEEVSSKIDAIFRQGRPVISEDRIRYSFDCDFSGQIDKYITPPVPSASKGLVFIIHFQSKHARFHRVFRLERECRFRFCFEEELESLEVELMEFDIELLVGTQLSCGSIQFKDPIREPTEFRIRFGNDVIMDIRAEGESIQNHVQETLLTIDIPQVQVSIIDSVPKELFLLTIDTIKCKLSQTEDNLALAGSIGSVQLDNFVGFRCFLS
jgi:hypothetical protein